MLAGAFAEQFQLPATQLGVASVHPQQIAGKQRRFVAARAGADFEEHVTGVVRVARQQQQLQRPLLFGAAGFGVQQFVLGQGAQLGIAVASQVAGRRQIVEHAAVGPKPAGHRLQLGILHGQGAEAVVIADDLGLGQQRADFLVTGRQLLQLGDHSGCHRQGFRPSRRYRLLIRVSISTSPWAAASRRPAQGG